MRNVRTTARAVMVVLALVALATAAGAKEKSPTTNKTSGTFVSFAQGTLTLNVGGNSQTFTVADKVPVKLGKEASMSPGAFVGLPKGTKVDLTFDENQKVSQVTIAKPNYRKR